MGSHQVAFPKWSAKTLALDFANCTGWSVITADLRLRCGNFTVPKKVSRGEQLIAIEDWLYQTMEQHQIERLAYEEIGYRHASTAAEEVYHGLVCVTLLTCERLKIAYLPVPSGTHKKFACGNGNAKKDKAANFYPVATSMAKKYRKDVQDHKWWDVADSLSVLNYAIFAHGEF